MTAITSIDRWAQINAFQTREYLARELAKYQEQQRWLLTEHRELARTGSCCGHMKVVHHGEGCGGLRGFDDCWSPCPCDGWEPRDDGITWAICAECGGNIFRHYDWSHEGGTPPQDHDAAPENGRGEA